MNITVKVSDLLKKVTELSKDNVDYVEISIFEEEEFLGERIPARISFEAYDGHGGGIDYENLDEVEISPHYKDNFEN
ncbi:hypothetical protein [Bacillus sp. B-jedd]|uniref:hypothetical protein n=1 Tax=Bacillus sp. B-jedd TaxID=1476857 RepID=UPI00051567FA|nr:hypothetical protein [Bacillus sp. B-jedd]CEG29781.1 hypothetical protein BN1002_04742 [Bacillus sp. B-jedd]